MHCNGHSVNSSIPYPTELFQFITFDWRSCRRSPKLSFPEWSKYLEEIATAKKLDVNEIKGKLAECGAPGTTGATVEQDFHFYFGKSSSCCSYFLYFHTFLRKWSSPLPLTVWRTLPSEQTKINMCFCIYLFTSRSTLKYLLCLIY